jgi:hypothetical protein
MGLSRAGRGYHQNLSLTYLQDLQFSFSGKHVYEPIFKHIMALCGIFNFKSSFLTWCVELSEKFCNIHL